jgi:hypothetical protein
MANCDCDVSLGSDTKENPAWRAAHVIVEMPSLYSPVNRFASSR